MPVTRCSLLAVVIVLSIVSAVAPSRAADGAPKVASAAGTVGKLLDHLAVDQLKVIDLSHVINSKTPDFFGDKDIYQFHHATKVEENGYSTGTFQTPEHFGTHVDAPVHFVKGAAPIDKIPAEHLILPAVVIDVRKQVEDNPDFVLTVPVIQEWEKQNKKIPSNAAVLLLTDWSQRWDSAKQYRNTDSSEQMHFPGYSAEGAKFLIEERKATAIGIDTLSIDPGDSKTYPVHKIAGSHDVYIMENLNNLNQLPPRGILLFCGCPALQDGTGCPSRIIALIDQPR
jgi:kynurenine formamidase